MTFGAHLTPSVSLGGHGNVGWVVVRRRFAEKGGWVLLPPPPANEALTHFPDVAEVNALIDLTSAGRQEGPTRTHCSAGGRGRGRQSPLPPPRRLSPVARSLHGRRNTLACQPQGAGKARGLGWLWGNGWRLENA